MPIYPFTAIVGQERMKRSLILNAIYPQIGGVLIRGERGTAKSTAARALAALLPEIEVVADCHFSCDPSQPATWCTECRERAEAGEKLPRAHHRTQFIDLPVSATEDRVVGTLDIERACSGMRLMMTMTALGVAMAFVNDRRLWQRFLMIVACVPIAILCNIIRVTTTGFMVVLGRKDLASGVPHMLLGLGMLAIAFGLYSALAYVLNHLFVESKSDEGHEATVTGGLMS